MHKFDDSPSNPNDELAKFGLDVLNILEKNENWSADTLYDIADTAIAHNLTLSDSQGLFCIRHAVRNFAKRKYRMGI